MIMVLRCFLVLAVTAGCAGERHAFTMHPVPTPGHARVNVVADDASVHVSTADIAQAEMQVVSTGYDLEKDLELSMTPHGDQIDIVAKQRWHIRLFDFTRKSLHLEIRVPRAADVAVRTGDGAIEVDAIAGSLDLRTGDGHIAIRGAHGGVRAHTGDGAIEARDLTGDIDASTGDGSIAVDRARGAIRLHSGDGAIEARDLDGTIDASSGDGNVTLAGRFDGLAAHSSDGGLTAVAAPGSRVLQPWHLDTSDGPVSLRIPTDLAAHLQARTGDGHVTSTIPLQQLGGSRVAGDLNGGGPPIDIRTGDGPIELSQR